MPNLFVTNIIYLIVFSSIIFTQKMIALPCNKNFNEQIIVLLSVLSILFLVKWIKKARSHSQMLPPGPRGLPIIGNLLSLDPELHTYFAALRRVHGPILTLKLGTKICVVITSPTVASEVLKDHDIIFANRPVPIVSPNGGKDIVFSPYGLEWRMLRRVCIRQMLGPATLDAVYNLRRKETRKMITCLYKKSNCEVDMGKEVFLMVMNVITSMLWGETVEEKERETIGAEFRHVVAEMTALLGHPNVSDFFPILAPFDLQGMGKRMRKLTALLDDVFDKVIYKRNKLDETRKHNDDGGGESSKVDFVEVLLKLKDEEDAKTPLTMIHVKALLMDMVVGGSDTTSNMVEFAMAELLNKPEVLHKAQTELDDVIGKNNIVEESDINKLPFLSAIMKEVLRLHPVLPLMVPHCPSETSIISGYTIPKEARVFINVWAIHRDPATWEDPEEFVPERFLDGKWDYTGKDFRYIPFGSGRRICAGIGMAERMVLFSLASLLHSFNWKVPNGERLEISEKFGIVLKRKVPLIAIPTPRLPDQLLYD